MMVFTAQNLVAEFMQENLNLRTTEELRGALFVKDEHLGAVMKMEDIGVAISWDNFIGRCCVISAVIQDKTCFTRAVIREAFRYPFQMAGLKAVLAMVDSRNIESFNLCTRLGFQVVHTVPDGGVEGDLIIMRMLKEECRWIRQEH